MTTDGKDQDKARSEQSVDDVSRESEASTISEDNSADQSSQNEIPQAADPQTNSGDSQVKKAGKSPQAAAKRPLVSLLLREVAALRFHRFRKCLLLQTRRDRPRPRLRPRQRRLANISRVKSRWWFPGLIPGR